MRQTAALLICGLLFGASYTTAVPAPYTCPSAATSAGALNCRALPLGDDRFGTAAPAAGTVYACNVPNRRGATGTLPWIDTNAKTWDALAKVAVQGSVTWNGTFNVTPSTDGRTLDVAGNGVPVAPITTGTFPIAASDPASRFDRNPNAIAAREMHYALPNDPVAARVPSCLPGGPIGVALDGVAIFDALDAAGKDAVAHEEQDACHGHPEMRSMYHYHGWLQSCVHDDGSPARTSTLLGYALDGYGIYGPWSGGKILTSADLDICHGTTSAVMWHGALTTVYHYVSTYDFPYTLGCYHGTPVRTGRARA